MKPRRLRWHSALIVGTALITLVAMRLSAVGHPHSSNGTASVRAQYADVVLDPDAAERVVVVVVRFPVGTAQDPVDREGAAFLLGRTLEGQGNRTLPGLGASVRIDVGAEEFLVTMISDPQGWQQAVRELEALLFRDGVSVVDLEFARAELLEVLEFEAGAPVRAFELERERFLLGASHPRRASVARYPSQCRIDRSVRTRGLSLPPPPSRRRSACSKGSRSGRRALPSIVSSRYGPRGGAERACGSGASDRVQRVRPLLGLR